MKKFQVLLKGENFLLNIDGELRQFGFKTTRWIKAADELEARKIATILTRQDPHLQANQINESQVPSRIVVEDVKEVGLLRFLWKKSANDFKFFSDVDV